MNDDRNYNPETTPQPFDDEATVGVGYSRYFPRKEEPKEEAPAAPAPTPVWEPVAPPAPPASKPAPVWEAPVSVPQDYDDEATTGVGYGRYFPRKEEAPVAPAPVWEPVAPPVTPAPEPAPVWEDPISQPRDFDDEATTGVGYGRFMSRKEEPKAEPLVKSTPVWEPATPPVRNPEVTTKVTESAPWKPEVSKPVQEPKKETPVEKVVPPVTPVEKPKEQNEKKSPVGKIIIGAIGLVLLVIIILVCMKSCSGPEQVYIPIPNETEEPTIQLTIPPTEEIVFEDVTPVIDEAAYAGIHRYEWIVDDMDWHSAQEYAKSVGGRLAAFETQEELEHVLRMVEEAGFRGLYLRFGARRDADDTRYYWVDKDNNTYGSDLNSYGHWISSYWLEGEPSISWNGVDEMYLQVYFKEDLQRWVLNDTANELTYPDWGVRAYIIEYDY